MKIVHVETVLRKGSYALSPHWTETRSAIHAAVERCDWPPNTGRFTINPVRMGNGVKPLKTEFIRELRRLEWTIEGPSRAVPY